MQWSAKSLPCCGKHLRGNTTAWRNSKSPSTSHSENILSASLLMVVSWIRLLDNWIYSFGKKNPIYLGTVGFLFRKQTNKLTLMQAAGCLLRAFSVIILWTEVSLRVGLCVGWMGIRLGMKQRLVLQIWLVLDTAPCSWLWNTPWAHLLRMMPASHSNLQQLPCKKLTGSMQAVYLPLFSSAQERFTPPEALNSSAIILIR